MGRDKRRQERLPPFVPLLIATLEAPAWRALSHGAKALYIALKRRYSVKIHNNGRLFLSQRKAAEEIGSHHNQIARWLRELQHYGFIVMMKPGCLGVEGKGQAPRWRLTELGYMNNWPTRDFAGWDGTPFVDKIKSRAGKKGRSVRENTHTDVQEKRPQEIETVREIPHKGEPHEREGNPAQNYFTTRSRSASAPDAQLSDQGLEVDGP